MIDERREWGDVASSMPQDRLRLAIEALTGYVYDVDCATGHVERSAGVHTLFGWEPDEVEPTVDWLWAMMHPDDHDRLKIETARTWHDPACDGMTSEYRIRHRDGRWVWLSDRQRFVRDASGRILRIVGAVTDVTTQAESERARARAEERFRLAADASGALVYEIDLGAGTTAIAHGLERVIGLAPPLEPLTTNWWHARIHPQDLDRHRDEIAHHIMASSTYSVQYRVAHADGGWRHVSDSGLVVRDSNGRAVRLVGVITDVTEDRVAAADRDFLLAIGAMVQQAGVSEDERALRATVTRAVGEYLGLARCVISDVDEVADELVHNDEWVRPGLAPVLQRYPLRAVAPDMLESFLADEPWVVTNAEKDRRTAAVFEQFYLPLGTRAAVATPLIRGGKLAAILAVISDAPRMWSAREIALTRAVADRLWPALQAAHALAAERAARTRAEALQRVSAALVEATVPADVMLAVTTEAIDAIGADSGAVGFLTDGGTVFDVSAGKMSEAILEGWRRFPNTPGLPYADVLTSGEAIFFESRDDFLACYPALREAIALSGAEGIAILPLVVTSGGERRPLGAINFNFHARHPFGADERAMLEALAQQCAQALDRARLHESEQAARERTERLQQLTAALAGTRSVAEVGDVVLRLGVRTLGASHVGVRWLDAEASALVSLDTYGTSPEFVNAWRRIPLDSPTPVAESVRRREAIFIESPATYHERYPDVSAVVHQLGVVASATLPLALGDRVIGAVTFAFTSPQHFDAGERAFLHAVAGQCAQACDRAALHEAELRARADLARAEEHLRTALEAGSLGSWVCELTTRRVWWSREMERLHGLEPGAFEGSYQAVEPFIDPAERTRVGRLLAATFERGEAELRTELAFTRADGAPRWLDVRGRVEYTAGGTPARIIGVAADVTERIETQAALRASEERYRLAARAVGGIVYDWDLRTGRLTRSEGIERVFGYAPDEAEESNGWWLARVHPEDLAGLPRLDDPSSPRPDTHEYEYRFRHRDGRWLHMRDRETIVRDATGQIVRIVGYAENITAEREAEAKLREAMAHAEAARLAAEQANRAKSDFLAVMSHELRTPLNAIAGHVQLMEMEIHGPVTAAQRDALERVNRSQGHLLRLINDVLNLARIETGRVEYEPRDLVLADVVAEVSPMIEPQLATKGIEYVVNVTRECIARADRDKTQQVLLNLLSNAVKFTPAGGRVTVDSGGRADAPPTFVYLRVSDTGFGIPADKLETIFEPFVQVDTSRTRTRDGIGLGLAISRDLARGMGGELRARSVVDRGSCFTLALPRASGSSSSDGS